MDSMKENVLNNKACKHILKSYNWKMKYKYYFLNSNMTMDFTNIKTMWSKMCVPQV